MREGEDDRGIPVVVHRLPPPVLSINVCIYTRDFIRESPYIHTRVCVCERTVVVSYSRALPFFEVRAPRRSLRCVQTYTRVSHACSASKTNLEEEKERREREDRKYLSSSLVCLCLPSYILGGNSFRFSSMIGT